MLFIIEKRINLKTKDTQHLFIVFFYKKERLSKQPKRNDLTNPLSSPERYLLIMIIIPLHKDNIENFFNYIDKNIFEIVRRLIFMKEDTDLKEMEKKF